MATDNPFFKEWLQSVQASLENKVRREEPTDGIEKILSSFLTAEDVDSIKAFAITETIQTNYEQAKVLRDTHNKNCGCASCLRKKLSRK